MATDIRVVVPADIGETIKLGAKEPNKYDVDVSTLDLPAGVSGLQLRDGVLTVVTSDGTNPNVDLKPMLPSVVADVFLKNVVKEGNELVFTVGAKGNTAQDTSLRVNVADLLPVVADGKTISGDGTEGSKLAVRISTTKSDNLLKQGADGLYLSAADIAAEPRTIRLTNASGSEVVGYIYNTEG